MTDVLTTPTSLKDAINIGLSCLGETPVSAPDNTSTNVVLAKQIIEEVSRDVQSKGWWFNTSGSDISLYANSGSGASENFNSSIPEEARRYIAIRAARVLQSRFVGSEELLKFSFQEEQVSLAVLTQAHVRNGGDSTSFNSFPADLKGMGVEEVMFLQQSAEEKLLSLRLVTELKSGDKLAAETALIADQEALVTQQALTEAQETAKRGSEKDLVDAQKSQVQTETVLKSQQALTELENTNLVAQNAIKTAAEAGVVTSQQALISQQVLDVVADIALKTKQGTKIDEEVDLLQTQDLLTSAQKDTELQNAIKVAADAGLVTSQQALVAQQVLDTVAETALKGAQKLKVEGETDLVAEQKALVTKQALTEVQNAIKVSADSGLVTAQQALVSQQVLDAAADIALKGKQGSLVDAQVTTEGKRPADIQADTTLKGSQSSLITAQTLTEAQNAIKVAADAGLVTAQQALVSQQILESVANVSNITADVALKGKQGSLVDAQATDVAADTTLKGKQGIKLDADTGLTTQQQALTAQQTLDVVADTALKGKQGSLIEKQALDVVADTAVKAKQALLIGQQFHVAGAETAKINAEVDLVQEQELKLVAEKQLIQEQKELAMNQTQDVAADTALKTSQKTQLDAQTAIEATAEKAFYDGVQAGHQNTYRDFSAEMRMMGFQESTFQSTPAYKKVELIKDAIKLRTLHTSSVAQLNNVGAEGFINKVMRLIGEPPISNRTDNALAAEASRLLEDTDEELQSRGWDFNTTDEEEFEADSDGDIHLQGTYYSIEVAGIPTQIKYNSFNPELLRRDGLPWTGKIKAKTIKRELNLFPQKYKEYLWVRVAILLTELYPQSGVDIQRLPKMEAELRAYFKDREADEANYSVFDNYDTASRIGINRNYDLS